MTTPQSQGRFMEWLEEAIERAEEDVADDDGNPNSYGAGYDQGYREALVEVREYFTGPTD